MEVKSDLARSVAYTKMRMMLGEIEMSKKGAMTDEKIFADLNECQLIVNNIEAYEFNAGHVCMNCDAVKINCRCGGYKKKSQD